MSLPDICIRRPVLATMMNLALVLFGVIALTRLPVRELPNIDPPIVNVTTIYPGANASVMETEVTERLEETINSIEGIRTLTSESREQVSAITVEFNLARDIEAAAQDVRDRIARVRSQLPDDIQEPIVAKQEADANPVIWIALFSDRFTTLELTTIAEDLLIDPLQTVKGVSSIYVGGRKTYATRLRLDPELMASRAVTVLDVEQALARQNVELPSGRVENRDREMTIETLGQMKTVAEFNRMVIRERDGALVRLSDIGRAEAGVEDERAIARYNSKPSIGLGVVKQSTANTIEVARAIKAELERLRPLLPEGINTEVPYDESSYVEESIGEVWTTLGIAFLLVVVTIFIFLRNIRSTLVPALAIPVSIVAAFIIMSVMGYSINTLTMLALVLAIGVVVDDAIVVLENIYRHVEEGLAPREAAHQGMKEITFAVIATTVALAAVFIPLAFQTTVTGRLFIEFAIALCGSVVISSFVALTLSPMLAARVLRPIAEVRHGRVYGAFERGFQRIERFYGRTLGFALRHRILTMGFAIGVVVLAGWFYQRLDQEFLPEEDKGRLLCFAITPEGSTSEYTDRMVAKMETIFRDIPEIRSYFSITAPARTGPGIGNQGLMFARLQAERERTVQDIVGGPRGIGARFFQEVEGAFAIPIIPKAVSRGFDQPFQLVLQGHDLDGLNRYAGELANTLRATGYLATVRTTFELSKPELRVHIDRDRAAALGVSITSISRTLQVLFGGQKVSQTTRAGKEYDVIAQLDRTDRLTPSDLERLYVRNDRGRLIQLNSVVSTETGGGPNAITHYNRFRSATIEATPQGIPLGEAVTRVEQVLREHPAPGFRHEWAGETRDFKEAGRGFIYVVILSLVIVYMVLASQFESLLHPLTVMLTVPLAAVGAFGALWLMARVNALGTSLYGWAHYAPNPPDYAHWLSAIVPRVPAMGINLFSQIGIVLLIGLVTKNSILLVDFANQRMAQGQSARDAMFEAGALRLRPILMTSFSTILGILPLAIGFGAGAESRRPMGVAAVGGMLTSTALTLVVIPVVYTLFSDMGRRLRGRGRRSSRGAATTATLLLFALGGMWLPASAARGAESADAAAAPPSYNLRQCLQTALKHNFEILKARERIRREDGVIVQVRSQLLPTLQLTGSGSQLDKGFLQSYGDYTPNDQSWSVRLELSQPIYAGGRALAAMDREQALREAALVDLRTVLSDVLLSVREQYFAALLAESEVAVQQQNIALLEDELQSAKNRLNAGTVSPFDVLRAEVALANAKPALIRVRNARRLALHELSRILGVGADMDGAGEPAVAVRGTLTYEPFTVSADAALDVARRNRPELQHYEHLLAAREAAVREARAGRMPIVSIYGDYGAYNDRFSSTITDELHGWEGGIRLNWDIWDGFLTKGRVAEAESELALTQLEADETRQRIDVEVRRAHSAFVEAGELVAATRKVVEQAEESLRMARARLQSGAATQLDVFNSQVQLTQARTNQIQALHDYNRAVAVLRHATGTAERIETAPARP